MTYPVLAIISGIIIGLALIIVIHFIERFRKQNQVRIFNNIQFEWICGKKLPNDQMPHWQCQKGQYTVCVLPPPIADARWRVLKERSKKTIGYEEIEEEEKAFELAVQWIK